ncbi:MAG: FliM/FliN family flagellar motor switch protein, partial [Pseudomonadota bacterium]
SLWSKAMTKAANGAELRLVAVMSQLKLSVEDIAALRPGSVVPLPEGVGMDVDMRLHRIGGVAEEPPLCAGALGASSGRRAVKVDEPPDDGFVDRIAPYMLR